MPHDQTPNQIRDFTRNSLFIKTSLRKEIIRLTNSFFYLGMTRNQEHEFGCFMTISLYDNYFKKENAGKFGF